MAELERRVAVPLELRLVFGRRLEGVALRYNRRAIDRAELFAPGAFAPVPLSVPLNLQHDPELKLGAAHLVDGIDVLRMTADLPEGSGVLDLVKRKSLRGLSVEFKSIQEDTVDGARRILKAALEGLAVVDAGSYETELEARAAAAAAARPRRVYL